MEMGTSFEKLFEDDFKPRITKELQKAILLIFKEFNKHNEKYTNDPKAKIELDQLRNQIFYEGVMTDNQCFVNIAYDLDEIICNDNLGVFEEIVERWEHILNSNDNQCMAKHCEIKRTFIEKIKWYDIFKEKTKNFTDVNGWSTRKN